MFYNKFNKDDPYGDLRRREEYEREQDINLAKGIFGFLTIYVLYFLIWIFTATALAMGLSFVFSMNEGLASIIAFFLSFFIFKISYTKTNPFKTLLRVVFVMILIAIIYT